MNNNIMFTEKAWGEYCYWQMQDKKTLKRINQIILDICRNEFIGIGKPEALKGNLSGFYSRRIDDVNRIIYKIVNNKIEIVQCRGHYENK